MAIIRTESERQMAIAAIRHQAAIRRIGCRWQPGHRVLRGPDGNYEEVNRPRPAPINIDSAAEAGEMAAWIAGCMLALVISATAKTWHLPPLLEFLTDITMILSGAMLGCLSLIVLLGGLRGKV
jgi:hypothetical protein